MSLCKYRKKAKTGRHCFKFDGKRYSVVPGNIIEVDGSALGSFIDDYDCLTPVTKRTSLPIAKEADLTNTSNGLGLVKVSRWMYNIINPDNPDKPLNDKPMKKAEAEKIMGEMMEIIPEPDTDLFEQLDWDSLIGIMEEEGIEILEEYETEDQLRDAIVAARRG